MIFLVFISSITNLATSYARLNYLISSMRPIMTENNPTTGALEKGLIVLQCLAQNTSRKYKFELKDIAQATALNKATLLRILATLQQYGFVIKHEDHSYSVGAMANVLGCRYRDIFQTNELIETAVRRISQQLNESVAFYVQDGSDRLCIYAKNSSRTIVHQFRVGQKIPLTDGGSAGHIINSYTHPSPNDFEQQLKQQGYCISIEEREKEQSSISVPVFDIEGKFHGSLIVAGLKSRMNQIYMRETIYPIIHEQMQQAGVTPPEHSF